MSDTTRSVTAENLPVVAYQGIRVITTDLLAQCYGASPKNIRDNFSNNKDRFVEGKHYFKLAGADLQQFKAFHCTESIGSVEISPRTRNLTLWTDRGAARHAKMLDTDAAWDVFEQLEDAYFNPRADEPEPPPPQPTSQLPLFLTKEELTAEFREVIRNGIHQAFRGAARGLIRVEVNNAMLDQREWMIEDIQQAVTAGINATFKTPAEAHFDQRAAEATEAAAKARTKAGKPDPQPEPIPPGRVDEGRHAEQRAQARERHHQDLRIEAVSGGTWKDYLRRHNISRLFTTEERQAMKAEFYQLQHACKPLAA